MTQQAFEQELADFLQEWRSDDPLLWVKSSGSTGTPKRFQAEKDRMRASARMTCDYLGLRSGDTALLCMSLDYIAGKMVVVRAEERGLRLIPVAPCGHPFAHLTETPTFAAVVPLQVYNTLQVPEECERMMRVKHLLIGGGAIDDAMREALQSFPNAVWSSYGMTETLSHIALQRINGSDASEWYRPLFGITLKLSSEGTLMIHAPHLCAQDLVTHDVAELREDQSFRILGRLDNIIDSGGIKIQLEEVEKLLHSHTDLPFQFTAIPDPKFGELLVLLHLPGDQDILESFCQEHLPIYWQPKRFIEVAALPLTETSKPDRATARRLARERA